MEYAEVSARPGVERFTARLDRDVVTLIYRSPVAADKRGRCLRVRTAQVAGPDKWDFRP
jgi:hypothetical protein